MKRHIIAPLLSAAFLPALAKADTILAGWTFETNTPADLANSAVGPTVAAEVGAGSFKSVHAAVGSDWTTPTGNGSENSYAGNNWAAGDYFTFQTSSTGYDHVQVSFDQASEAAGPRDFALSYSLDGSTFFNAFFYSVSPNASAWNTTSAVPADHFDVNLSGHGFLNDASTIIFRLTQTSNTAANGGIIGGDGVGRIDNIYVTGAPIVAVPAPQALLVGPALLLLAHRVSRRRMPASS